LKLPRGFQNIDTIRALVDRDVADGELVM